MQDELAVGRIEDAKGGREPMDLQLAPQAAPAAAHAIHELGDVVQPRAKLAEQMRARRQLVGPVGGAASLGDLFDGRDEVGRASHADEGALLVKGERPLGLRGEELSHLRGGEGARATGAASAATEGIRKGQERVESSRLTSRATLVSSRGMPVVKAKRSVRWEEASSRARRTVRYAKCRLFSRSGWLPSRLAYSSSSRPHVPFRRSRR